jgi:hypothetical protein
VTLGANSTHRYEFHFGIIFAALVAMVAVAATRFLCYGVRDQLARILKKKV